MVKINLELENSQAELLVLLLKQITDEQICEAKRIDGKSIIPIDNSEIYSIIDFIETKYNNRKDLKFSTEKKINYEHIARRIYPFTCEIVDITSDYKYVIKYIGEERYGLGHGKMKSYTETITEEELLKYNN